MSSSHEVCSKSPGTVDCPPEMPHSTYPEQLEGGALPSVLLETSGTEIKGECPPLKRDVKSNSKRSWQLGQLSVPAPCSSSKALSMGNKMKPCQRHCLQLASTAHKSEMFYLEQRDCSEGIN